MKRIEAFIREDRLDAVQQALDSINVTGMTVTEVMGHAKEKGYKDYYGRSFFGDRKFVQPKLIPKIKLEIYVEDQLVELMLRAIRSKASTGRHGDGKIFITSNVEEVIRIRTGEAGKAAV